MNVFPRLLSLMRARLRPGVAKDDPLVLLGRIVARSHHNKRGAKRALTWSQHTVQRLKAQSLAVVVPQRCQKRESVSRCQTFLRSQSTLKHALPSTNKRSCRKRFARISALGKMNTRQAIGVKPDDRGLLDVNDSYQTAQPSIYACGDVIGYPALASTSMEQGVRAAHHMWSQNAVRTTEVAA